MVICKHDEEEENQTTAALLLSQAPAVQPALPAADDNEGDEAQWAECLAEMLLRTDGECVDGCDRSDGALSSGGCRW